MQCFLRFEFPFELVYRVQIANYIPSDEDLNYPAKLEQLAEKKSETTSCHYFCCFNALCIYTLESILFLGFAFSSVFTRCYMGLAKGDGIGLHANEFQFITWYPPLEKTPSSLSFKVVPKFRTSSVHWFGSGNSGSLLCINTGKHCHSASVASSDGEDETSSAESFYTNNSFQHLKGANLPQVDMQ
ncbi:hypothetical protein Q3G72_023841 [Acer saccharum]|nr:hypothetical protein Q3G72_023841 [Acer saccharum]